MRILSLDRHVERRDGLVGDENVGLDRQRACDADTLPLPSRKFVRIAIGGFRVESDERQEFARFLQRRGSRFTLHDGSLGDELADGSARIERAVGILKYQLDILTDGSHLPA